MKRLTKLKKDQVFVFGSNLNGNHAGGAAADAVKYFGAAMGNAVGIQGQSYAIPTLGTDMEKLDIPKIGKYVKDLFDYAIKHEGVEFIITPIGCGIAGFYPDEIAPLFNDHPQNLIMPDEFLSIRTIHGYKAMDLRSGKFVCRDFEFEVGKTYHFEGSIELCAQGFHFCRNGGSVYEYYGKGSPVFEVRASGSVKTEGDKSVTDTVTIVRQLSDEEAKFNTGDRNTGYRNTGYRNTGYRNTGDMNTGDRNTGDRNTGYMNTGDRNTGDRNTGYMNTGYMNTGDRNTGYRNTGYMNTGDRNTGYRNTGDMNTGDRNTGDFNSGNFNSGFFNTDEPTVRMFNKETGLTRDQIKFPDFFFDLEITKWIFEVDMTVEEKKAQPNFYVAGGYLKKIEYKDAWRTAWNDAKKTEKKKVLKLPNFNNALFFQITGIDVEKELKGGK